MYLNVYANHMKGVQVMTTINVVEEDGYVVYTSLPSSLISRMLHAWVLIYLRLRVRHLTFNIIFGGVIIVLA